MSVSQVHLGHCKPALHLGTRLAVAKAASAHFQTSDSCSFLTILLHAAILASFLQGSLPQTKKGPSYAKAPALTPHTAAHCRVFPPSRPIARPGPGPGARAGHGKSARAVMAAILRPLNNDRGGGVQFGVSFFEDFPYGWLHRGTKSKTTFLGTPILNVALPC